MKSFPNVFAFFGQENAEEKFRASLLMKTKNFIATDMEGQVQARFTMTEIGAIPAPSALPIPEFSGDRVLRDIELIEHKSTLRIAYNPQ